ncbi:MAG: M28 family peptidase [Saprospiraceae bacterium]
MAFILKKDEIGHEYLKIERVLIKKRIKSIHIILVVFLVISNISGQSEVQKVTSTVTKNRVKAHLTFIASDELKGRDVGSDGIGTAAMYIKTQLMSYGVSTSPNMESYFQNVTLVTLDPPSDGTILIGDLKMTFPDDFVVLGGTDIDAELTSVFADFKNKKSISIKKVKDKIVVAICGDGTTQSVQGWFYQSKERIEKLKKAGAKGLIELYQSNKVPFKFLKQQFNRTQTSLSSDETDDFLHLWVNASTPEKVAPLKEKSTLNLDIKVPDYNSVMSKNVVGYVEGNDPLLKNEYIVYSAHYDHIGIGKPNAEMDSIYNGARDNAVGVTAILELARNIAKYPTKRSALFVFFTAEEKGLLGSKYFVDHAPVPLENIVYNFNIDNGGYNDTTIVSVIGLERTTAESDIQDACKAFGLQGIEDPAKEQGLFDRSDNVNFAKKGIPAPTFSLGFRSFDAEIFKYYHQAGDEVNTLNLNYLLKYFRAYTLASRNIANAQESPFWVKNDKYYKAGKKRYKK